jgi:hypothetical protein
MREKNYVFSTFFVNKEQKLPVYGGIMRSPHPIRTRIHKQNEKLDENIFF